MILHPTIYKDDNAELFLEKSEIGVFIHCYVYKWSKESFRQFQEIWDSVLDSLLLEGYKEVKAAIEIEDIKLFRFASFFGFLPTGTFISDTKGAIREVYTCLT